MQHACHGMSINQMLKRNLAPPDPAGINYSTVPHSLAEGQRNYMLQSWLGRKNFMGNDVTRVILPGDNEKTQLGRDMEWRRQASMPWGNHFMVTGTDAKRLNNPQQEAFIKQRQLSIPNTYQQFYAFMHALSAAFGNVTRSQTSG